MPQLCEFSTTHSAPAVLVGHALRRYPAATTRGCWNYAYASFLNDHDTRVLKEGWDRTAAAQRFFKDNEVGVAPVHGPLLVIAGETDETVPMAHVQSTVRKACDHGITLAFRSYPGLDHDPVMEQSTPDQLAWIRDRVRGSAMQEYVPGSHCAGRAGRRVLPVSRPGPALTSVIVGACVACTRCAPSYTRA